MACAYLVDGDGPDPLAGVLDAVRGYHATRPLATEDLQVLPGLLMGRLATTVLIQGARLARAPHRALEATVLTADLRLRALQALGEKTARRRLLGNCGLPGRD